MGGLMMIFISPNKHW